MSQNKISLSAAILPLLLTHCAHTHLNTRITRLPYHASQFEAMNRLGSPFQISRKKELDHWVYKFTASGKEYTRKLVFKNGRLILKGKPKPYPPTRLILDGVTNLMEYNEAVERFQKKKKEEAKQAPPPDGAEPKTEKKP